MKNADRLPLRSTGILLLLLASVGCDTESVLPTAPSPPPVGAMGAGSETEKVGLKATRPSAVRPKDALVHEYTPHLVSSRAQAAVEAAREADALFEHEFLLEHVLADGQTREVDRGYGTPVESGQIAYEVQRPLDLRSSYVWRVRAALAGEFGPWSEPASFTTVAARLERPQPIAPIGPEPVGTLRPLFRVRNGNVEGPVEVVTIEIRVVRAGEALADAEISGSGEARGETGARATVELDFDLELDTEYVWHARGTAFKGLPDEVQSDWSDTVMFKTRSAIAPMQDEEEHVPLGPAQSPPPNLLHVVRRVAERYPEKLEAAFDEDRVAWTGNFDFMDELLRALRHEDGGRWGFTLWGPTRIANDLIGYYRGDGDPHGSSDMAILDVLAYDGRGVVPSWQDATERIRRDHPEARGKWKYPR